MRRITVGLSDELSATLRLAAARDRTREAAWVREAIIAKAARGEALELLGDPVTGRQLAAIEARLASIEQRLGPTRTGGS